MWISWASTLTYASISSFPSVTLSSKWEMRVRTWKPACGRSNKVYYRSAINIVPPVPPYRFNKKLIFWLCRTCVQPCSTGECVHTDDEDLALTGTWVTEEVRLSFEKGYRILEIYEVYDYQVTQYIPETGEGGHFVDYKTPLWNWKRRRADIMVGFEALRTKIFI